MKIDRVFFQGKYSIHSQFLDTTLQAEGVLEEGETMEKAIAELRKRVSLVADSFRLKIDGSVLSQLPPEEQSAIANQGIPISNKPIHEYNLQDEQTEIEIDNATTLEELAALKPDLPSRLVSHYMKRLKELTSK